MSELVHWLESGTPSIRTRNHQLKEGLVQFDTRELVMEHVAVIRERVAAFVREIQ